jgi:hypothetical protein
MPSATATLTRLLETIVEHLDIPRSYYEKAVARHKSLGEWLCRPGSKLAVFQPHVSAQGSFRFGTVVRPLLSTDEYDLDNVTVLNMAKTAMTQRDLKQLYGTEVKAYARSNGMTAEVEEKNRCWRVPYGDEVQFHLDTLACVPEGAGLIAALISRGVPPELASRAIAITDRRHPKYHEITSDLLSSNPRGFAHWFEMRARLVAMPRLRQLVERRLYASVEDVPPYEWKTPLQASIQILKRHRDVMFRDDPSAGPISMIITNLAAHAYDGETDLALALTNIVERMPRFVKPTRPRVPNPADPAEDYADRWTANPTLEDKFWLWLTQVKADVGKLATSIGTRRLVPEVESAFRVELTTDEMRVFGPAPQTVATTVAVTAPVVHIPSAPRPWGSGD